MTREEASKTLTQYIDYDAETPDYYEMEKACKVALKALKQAPCEDAISRQAVLEAIMTNCILENEYNLTSSRIKKAVESLPPVTPKPKMGHWIKDNPWTKAYCSKCGESCIGLHGFDFIITDFCPNCGAKMEESE